MYQIESCRRTDDLTDVSKFICTGKFVTNLDIIFTLCITRDERIDVNNGVKIRDKQLIVLMMNRMRKIAIE